MLFVICTCEASLVLIWEAMDLGRQTDRSIDRLLFSVHLHEKNKNTEAMLVKKGVSCVSDYSTGKGAPSFPSSGYCRVPLLSI